MRFSAEGTISDQDINGDRHGEKLRAKSTLSKSGKIVCVATNQREIIYPYLTGWEVSSLLSQRYGRYEFARSCSETNRISSD